MISDFNIRISIKDTVFQRIEQQVRSQKRKNLGDTKLINRGHAIGWGALRETILTPIKVEVQQELFNV